MATNHIPNLEGCIIEKFDLACMNTLKKMRVENEWENGKKKAIVSSVLGLVQTGVTIFILFIQKNSLLGKMELLISSIYECFMNDYKLGSLLLKTWLMA